MMVPLLMPLSRAFRFLFFDDADFRFRAKMPAFSPFSYMPPLAADTPLSLIPRGIATDYLPPHDYYADAATL